MSNTLFVTLCSVGVLSVLAIATIVVRFFVAPKKEEGCADSFFDWLHYIDWSNVLLAFRNVFVFMIILPLCIFTLGCYLGNRNKE